MTDRTPGPSVQESVTSRTRGRPAVFLDRDGTVTEPRHYPRSPSDLVLQTGVADALRELQHLGAALVLVTNQSGLARGYFTWNDLESIHAHLGDLLGASGVRLDGIYVCPHHPEGTVTGLAVHCKCRKPNAGLLMRAADELGLDLKRSWMVGDFASDVLAGHRAGCRTAWVGPAAVNASGDRTVQPDLRRATTAEALHELARATGGSA
ncbi:D-glycero-alpha-D-manno-heptose-1,7-bisphosphate 7-phosphatase [Streptomyces sp. NPDC057620]|uniref:D-glycero-alpha-D-manno-heptose-1,7-bisphosphate 7-phosphatase n=1 Tax=Streptomyces sp. NPDC057620 TaxID=3346185 RepID=UPI00369CB36A